MKPIYGEPGFPPGRKLACDIIFGFAIFIFLLIGVILFLGAVTGSA